MTMTQRVGSHSRTTSESDISVEINLDGPAHADITTGLPFFDHMLTAFAVHGGFGLRVAARGDIEVDAHHTVEDTAIVLGEAFAKALGDKAGITRFGQQQLPMDEALVEAVVDISGRPYCVFTGEHEHFFDTFAKHAGLTLHVRCHYGRDPHHITEAEFKAVARALRTAVLIDPKQAGHIPSTKGAL